MDIERELKETAAAAAGNNGRGRSVGLSAAAAAFWPCNKRSRNDDGDSDDVHLNEESRRNIST